MNRDLKEDPSLENYPYGLDVAGFGIFEPGTWARGGAYFVELFGNFKSRCEVRSELEQPQLNCRHDPEKRRPKL